MSEINTQNNYEINFVLDTMVSNVKTGSHWKSETKETFGLSCQCPTTEHIYTFEDFKDALADMHI